MPVVLQGNLRTFPPAQIMSFLAANGHGGTLDLEADNQRARIFFEKGKIVAAEGSEPGDSRESVLEVFAWADGKFTFLDSAAIPAGTKRVDLELEPLIAEGQRRAAEGNLYADDDMLSVVDNIVAQGKITMSPEEFKLLFSIGQGRAFKELLGEGVKRRDMALKIQALENAGLVNRGAGGKRAPAAAASKPAVQVKPVEPLRAAEPEKAPEPPKSAEPQKKAEPKKAEAPPKAAEAPAPQKAAAPPKKSDAEYEKTVMGDLGLKPSDLKKTLVGVLTQEGGGPFPLVDDATTIGRDPSNAISVQDGSISTRHARIVRKDGVFMIEDLQSRNGTFLNGEQITKDAKPLADGDLLRLGKVIMTFNLPKEEASGDSPGDRTMFQPPA